MAKSIYENTSNKDLVDLAIERKLTVETAVIWEGEVLKSPEREALISMLEKDDESKLNLGGNPNSKGSEDDNPEIYSVTENILINPTGYSAKIDDMHIMVVPHLYGEGFDSKNQKIRVIKEYGFVLMDGKKTDSGKFENLTDNQLFELVSAGVIKMTEDQTKAFRLKFYGIKTKK